jgi:hypothetical protein
MSFFKSININKLSGIFTVLFIFAWFFCSAHISFSPEIAQANALPDSHHSSSSDEGGATQVCVDHSPTQHVSRYQNDVSNTPVLISNATDQVINQINKVTNFNVDFVRDGDHLSMRYSFLVHSKFLI